MSVFSKFVTAGLKAAFNKKGKLKKTERAVISRQVNKAVKALEITPTEAQKGLRAAAKAPPPPKKKAGTFKPKKKNPPTKKDKGSNKGLSASERKEKSDMMRQSRAEIKKRKRGQDIDDNPSDAPGGRQEILIDVPGTKGRRQRQVADPQHRLKGTQKFSAEEMKNWTPAEIEEYNRMGFGGSGRAMKDQMLGSGKRSGKGVGDMDTQSKKSGGIVKRSLGGGAKPKKKKEKPVQTAWSLKYSKKKPPKSPTPSRKVRGKGYGGITPVKKIFRRGGGQALRGFGKATYSNKLY